MGAKNVFEEVESMLEQKKKKAGFDQFLASVFKIGDEFILDFNPEKDGPLFKFGKEDIVLGELIDEIEYPQLDKTRIYEVLIQKNAKCIKFERREFDRRMIHDRGTPGETVVWECPECQETARTGMSVKMFMPDISLDETNDLSETGCGVEVEARGTPVLVNVGDTVIWDHDYTGGGQKGYKIMDSGPVDVEKVKVYGAAGNSRWRVNLFFYYSTGDSESWTWTRTPSGNDLTIRENDALGDMKDRCICKFRIKTKLISGIPASVDGFDFCWETDCIEKC